MRKARIIGQYINSIGKKANKKSKIFIYCKRNVRLICYNISVKHYFELKLDFNLKGISEI